MKAMKDSGMEWIGKVPVNWDIIRIGALYSVRAKKVSDEDFPPLSVTKNGILPQLENVAKTDDRDNRKLVREGDFVINSRSDRRGSCGISTMDGSVSLINIVAYPHVTIYPGYYNWLFHSSLFADEFYAYGHGIVDDLWTTNWTDMKKISVPYPSYEIQKSISLYLDTKCAEIDALMEDIKAEITTLEEYKKSLITETVTKGLNTDVELKDSGVEWMGKIPKSWDIHKAKYHIIITNGSNPHLSGDTPVYGSGTCSFKTCGEYKEGPCVLVGRKGSIATPQYIDSKYWNVDTAFDVKPQKGMILRYYYYLASSFDYLFYISQTTVPSMKQSDYQNMKLPIPSFSEQGAIVSFLDTKCVEIDTIINAKKEQLTTLDEYKKSLIYEYATGKKEIPQS